MSGEDRADPGPSHQERAAAISATASAPGPARPRFGIAVKAGQHGKGTGLGLSTVHGIVHQSGGTITVTSQPGHGSMFLVDFPQVDEVEKVERAPAALETAIRGTVLVVEDHEEVRDLACRILKGAGHVVLEAGGPVEALRVADLHPGPIHVVLTDVVMPEGNGRELARELVARRSDLRVIFMSGYTSDEILHHGVLESGVPFVEKPFTAAALRSKVTAVLSCPQIPVP